MNEKESLPVIKLIFNLEEFLCKFCAHRDNCYPSKSPCKECACTKMIYHDIKEK